MLQKAIGNEARKNQQKISKVRPHFWSVKRMGSVFRKKARAV